MKQHSLLKILSRGPEIVHTNFWDTEIDFNSYAMSDKEDCLRLLVPRCHNEKIVDMVQCEYVIVSMLKSIRPGKHAIELLFQDHSNDPFIIITSPEAFIGPLPQVDTYKRGTRKLTIWAEGIHKVAELPIHIRFVPKLPWLRPLRR